MTVRGRFNGKSSLNAEKREVLFVTALGLVQKAVHRLGP
jgi:hypothetical protein